MAGPFLVMVTRPLLGMMGVSRITKKHPYWCKGCKTTCPTRLMTLKADKSLEEFQ